MSGNYQYKIYHLLPDGQAYKAAQAWKTLTGSGYNPHPDDPKLVAHATLLGYGAAVEVEDGNGQTLLLRPRITESPYECVPGFYMHCPIGRTAAGAQQNFVPAGSREIKMGISGLVFGRAPIVFEVKPELKPAPAPAPTPAGFG